MGRKDKSETRKPEILENFFQVMKEEGIEGASIAKIAKKMDIHPSLIIHYFKTKEDMVVALAGMMFEKYIITGLSDIRTITNAEDRFDALLDGMLFRRMAKDDQKVIFPVLIYLASRNNDIRTQMKKNITQIHHMMSEEMQTLMDAEIIKKMDPEMLVRFISMIGTGLEHYLIMFKEEASDDKMLDFIKQSVKGMLV